MPFGPYILHLPHSSLVASLSKHLERKTLELHKSKCRAKTNNQLQLTRR